MYHTESICDVRPDETGVGLRSPGGWPGDGPWADDAVGAAKKKKEVVQVQSYNRHGGQDIQEMF